MASIVVLASILINQGCKDREPNAPIEIERPKILTMMPTEGALVVPKNSEIRLVFDERMNLETFPGRFLLKNYEGEVVEGTFSENDSIVIFKTKSGLAKSTIYNAVLRGRVRDINNNSIGINNEGVFDETMEITKGWFYTEGDYSDGGFYNIFIRDRKEGSVRRISNLDTVTATIGSFKAPEGMAISSDGKYLLISNTSANEIAIIDLSSNEIVKRIATAANPSSIVTNQNYAYCISVNGKKITKINTTSLAKDAELNLSFYPGKLAISDDGTILYTLDQVSRDLYLLNSSTGAVIKKITNVVQTIVLGEIKYDSQNQQLIICDSKGLKIKAVDKNGTQVNIVQTLLTGNEPIEVAFSPSNALVAAGKGIILYDRNLQNVVNTMMFSTSVKSITIVPTGELIYANLATSTVIIDLKTFKILKEINMVSSGIESIITSPIKY